MARFYYPAGVAVDAAGNVYVADQINSTIRKLTPLGSNNWAVTTIAGTAGANGSVDGTNNAARFYWPSDLSVNGSGILFVADTFNNTIRKIALTGSNFVVSTICGVTGVSGSVDGTNSGALLDGPGGISLDGFGNLLVADSCRNARAGRRRLSGPLGRIILHGEIDTARRGHTVYLYGICQH